MAELNPIRRLRTALGLSQEKFARQLGISTASIRAYEGGQKLSESSLNKLKTLAAQNMLPDIAIDLDSRPFTVAEVFPDGKKVRLRKHPRGSDLAESLHAELDRVLENGNAEALAAVEAVLYLASSASKTAKSGAK